MDAKFQAWTTRTLREQFQYLSGRMEHAEKTSVIDYEMFVQERQEITDELLKRTDGHLSL